MRRRKSKMIGSQRKVILNFLGIPLSDIPNKAEDQNKLIEAFKKSDPEKFDRAYSIIVDGIVPDQENATQTDFQFREVAQLISEYLEPMRRAHDDVLSEQLHRFSDAMNEDIENIKNEVIDEADRVIKKAAEKYHRVEIKVGNKKPIKMDDVVHEKLETVLQLAANRINVLLVGPAGSGKTHMGAQVAKALGLDYASQSCSSGMSESQLTGWLIPVGEGGKFEYVTSEFVRIYENGGVFLLDELDAADANVLVMINQALANDHFYIPLRHGNAKVKKHKDFVPIAAANTFGNGADSMYSARNQLDAATMDRFRIGTVGIGYSPAIEEMLIDPDVLDWGRKVREFIDQKNLRRIMSTRVMKDATVMKNAGWTMGNIANSYFADWSKEEMMMYDQWIKIEEVGFA